MDWEKPLFTTTGSKSVFFSGISTPFENSWQYLYIYKSAGRTGYGDK